MTSLIKGALGYVIPDRARSDNPQSGRASPTDSQRDDSKDKGDTHQQGDDSKNKGDTHQQGYLKKAVSGICSVGSSTVGVGVTGVKWIAGSTYAVGTGVAGAVGSVAGSAAGAVGSGASVILSKVTPGKTSKEHND